MEKELTFSFYFFTFSSYIWLTIIHVTSNWISDLLLKLIKSFLFIFNKHNPSLEWEQKRLHLNSVYIKNIDSELLPKVILKFQWSYSPLNSEPKKTLNTLLFIRTRPFNAQRSVCLVSNGDWHATAGESTINKVMFHLYSPVYPPSFQLSVA